LLRGLLTADQATMDGVTRLMRPGAVLSLLVSVAARDGGVGMQPIWDGTLHRLADAYDNHGLTVTQARPATVADVTAAHSTWGKRLGAGVKRQAWQIGATMQPYAARGDVTGGLRGASRCAEHRCCWAFHDSAVEPP
jgi:16S rRNA (adenine(1408)-N(1))-methyltransferase